MKLFVILGLAACLFAISEACVLNSLVALEPRGLYFSMFTPDCTENVC